MSTKDAIIKGLTMLFLFDFSKIKKNVQIFFLRDVNNGGKKNDLFYIIRF